MRGQFFTIESMLTLTGASGTTFLIANGLQRAFNFNPKWLALAIAQIISLFGVLESSKCQPIDFFVGIVNGFLIYSTAVGSTAMIAKKDSGNFESLNTNAEKPQRSFNSNWF